VMMFATFGILLIITIIIIFVILYHYYVVWLADFKPRKSKEDPACISYLLAPKVNSVNQNINSSNPVDLGSTCTTGRAIHIENMRKKSNSPRIESIARKELKEASHLNMDHVRISFLQFLWGMLFIQPNAIILWALYVPCMSFRRWIVSAFNFKYLVVPQVVEETVAEVVLETMLVIGFIEIKNENGEGDKANKRLGSFRWDSVPILNNKDSIDMYNLNVLIDLDNRRFISGQAFKVNSYSCLTSICEDTAYDDTDSNHNDKKVIDLCVRDALVMLFFYLISANHVKIHSYANWGVNPDFEDAELRTYAVATIMYNYFGKISFPHITGLFHKLGIASCPFRSVTDAFDIGILAGVTSHFNLHFLKPHESKLVNFITLTRKRFLELFPNHKHDFKKVQGEAMFIGTVIHSLDHTQMQWTIKDPLWLEAENEEFQMCAELCRIVRAGFVPDIPFLTWSHRFYNAKHPLFNQLYSYAAEIDKRMADAMDCCIIK